MPTRDQIIDKSNGYPVALLIIDVQKGLDAPVLGKRNNPHAESNMLALLAAWRQHGLPVIHVQHNSTEPDSSLRPDADGNEFKQGFAPLDSEPLYAKSVNSAFIGTTLESDLRETGINELVVVGLTTDHCVSSTVRMAADLGFAVTLVDDATATFERISVFGRAISADEMHEVNITSLNKEFCSVAKTNDVISSFSQE